MYFTFYLIFRGTLYLFILILTRCNGIKPTNRSIREFQMTLYCNQHAP